MARSLGKTSDLANTVVGTPYSMAPELCHSQPYSFKSDVWALGCLFYEILTYNHAFEGSSLLNLVWKIVQDAVAPLPECYSANVQALVDRMLVKEPEARADLAEIIHAPLVEAALEAIPAATAAPMDDSYWPLRTNAALRPVLHTDSVADASSAIVSTQKSPVKARSADTGAAVNGTTTTAAVTATASGAAGVTSPMAKAVAGGAISASSTAPPPHDVAQQAAAGMINVLAALVKPPPPLMTPASPTASAITQPAVSVVRKTSVDSTNRNGGGLFVRLFSCCGADAERVVELQPPATTVTPAAAAATTKAPASTSFATPKPVSNNYLVTVPEIEWPQPVSPPPVRARKQSGPDVAAPVVTISPQQHQAVRGNFLSPKVCVCVMSCLVFRRFKFVLILHSQFKFLMCLIPARAGDARCRCSPAARDAVAVGRTSCDRK